MTFFEQELRNILEFRYPDTTFVGRACYVKLGEMNRAKVQFVTCGVADHYEALQLTVLNRKDGQIDTLRLRFADILGKGRYAWTYKDTTEWYGYNPSSKEYLRLADAVSDYLELFQDQTMSAGRQWQQNM